MGAQACVAQSVKPVLSLFLVAGLAVIGWKTYSAARSAAAVSDSPTAMELKGPAGVSAIARLEPKDGVRRIAGPSRPTVVIGALFVEEGDHVRTGQPVAVLDSFAVLQSRVARLRARLENAEAEFRRHDRLYREHTDSVSARDKWYMQVEVARADLGSAQAELDLATVRSPIDGQVLKIHARAGERVGGEGIAEIGATDSMYAVAEVYETDVGRVRVGQRAKVTSAAFPRPLDGTVERVGLRVARQDVLHTDPAAETDARVVEVKVRLDDSRMVAGLTNLEAAVVIAPAGGEQ